MLARIEDKLGAKLPLGVLVEAPTLEQLAARVEIEIGVDTPQQPRSEVRDRHVQEAGWRGRASRSMTCSEEPGQLATRSNSNGSSVSRDARAPRGTNSSTDKGTWSSLVKLKEGPDTRPPLFLTHGAGGTVLVYRELAERLGAHQTVYGLQARGLDPSVLAPHDHR